MSMLVALGAATPALAQMSMANGAPPTASVVRVNRCDPQLQQPAVAGPYVGFAPGYYPGRGPYYRWNDVYGYRYNQAAMLPANGTLYLDYVNVTHKEMTTIEFGLIANGHLVAEVRDVGKFSPNIEIKHEFGLSPNVFPIQTGLPQCPALRITFADGTKWVNPRLPRLEHKLYGQ
ncbi:MAG TPA: hypothetical protein VGP41_14975 [Candidatus Lustribacter sp.]|nr:hypothetical protein [Candidatus Lustribacter sp.]